MPEVTLEMLTKRVEEIERRLATMFNAVTPASVIAPAKDWRSVVGISEETEFSRLMLTEIEAAHEADREAALKEFGE